MRLSLLLLLVFALGVDAAPVKLTPLQIKSLGVQTAPLTRHAGSLSPGMPATVVVPDAQTRVLAAPVSGLVLATLAEEGEPVRRGQVLLRLSSPELIAPQGELAQAASRMNLARENARRDQALLGEGIIAETRARASAAALAQAQAALNAQRALLRAQGLDAAALARAERGEGYTSEITLSAPISGVITARQAVPGSRVEAASALYVLASLKPLWIEIDAPADVAMRARAGMKVDLPGRGIQGTILRVLPLAGAAQTVRIRARIEDFAAVLRPGQSVAVRIEGLGDGVEWRVPASAVVREAGRTYLFVRRADGFVARPVRVLAQSANRVSLAGEFKDGERVAVSGIAALKAAWLGANDAE